MANRSRGRGRAASSITAEQLSIARGESQPPPVLQPPPKYPALDIKAPSYQPSTEVSYLWELKRDFAETMEASPNNVLSIVLKKDIERYSDCYAKIIEPDEVNWDQRYDWTMFPKELKPFIAKRKAKALKTATKKLKEVDIEKKLQELEQKEKTVENDAEEEDKGGENGEEKNQDDNVEEEEVEVDEEMDEGTDYGNNYFDNGEGYDDEDDNIDDGPIF